MAAVTAVAVLVMLAPATVLGTVLPYLLRLLQERERQPGDVLGRLVATNTLGAILGSLAAGFVLLPGLGAYRSLLVVAAVYPVLAAGVLLRRASPRRALGTGLATATGLALVALPPQGLESIRLRADADERVLDLREGPQAHVAVVDRDGSRAIRVNNYYTLGSSGARVSERNQTVVPMLTDPDPRSVFYLGMGTGITAGASLDFPVERVVVCELIGDVVAAAERYFRPWTNGLFSDERAQVHAEDGRTCLRRSDERYDVIISDLFTPWKAGTGNLYTLEHYRTARDRLKEDGVFVQWMPLYQVSQAELGSIAATMDEAFEQVVMWRGDLYASRSIVALVGHADDAPLDPEVVVANAREAADDEALEATDAEALALRMYVGNVAAGGVFDDHPLNTDSRPVVEYLAPRTHREVRTGRASFLTGERREDLYERIRTAAPVEEDPYLARLTETQREHVRAGHHYSRYAWESSRDGGQADEAYERFVAHSPEGVIDALSPARALRPAFGNRP